MCHTARGSAEQKGGGGKGQILNKMFREDESESPFFFFTGDKFLKSTTFTKVLLQHSCSSLPFICMDMLEGICVSHMSLNCADIMRVYPSHR